jgi:hypothetical protein
MVYLITGMIVLLLIVFLFTVYSDDSDSIFDEDGNYKPYKFPWEK